jgi:hypothetical protein
MRVTRDPLWLNARLARGRWLYRISHAVIFRLLSVNASSHLHRHKIRHTARVFGLLQNGQVDERFVLGLLPRLPDGDSELYSHPSLEDFKHEFDALISPGVKTLAKDLGIELVRYQDI